MDVGERGDGVLRRRGPILLISCYELYASLNAEYLLERVADSVIGGEFETPLLGLIQALEEGQPGQRPNCWQISNESPPGKDDGDALDDRCESF